MVIGSMEGQRGTMTTSPPGPKGEQWGQLNYQYCRTDTFGFLSGLCERYGDIVGFDLGRSACILVNGGAQVRELLFEREACLRKPDFVKDSNRGHWGDGLTTLEHEAWQDRRRALRPSFRAQSVAARLPVVAECTADLLDAWASSATPDLPKDLRTLTARIAARVVLDAELEGFGPCEGRSGVLPFAEAYGEDYASVPGGDPTAPLVMKRPRAPRRMDTVLSLIDERIASGQQRGDVLSDLVRARLPDGSGLSRAEIVGEVIQMLYAGHLTIPFSLENFWREATAADSVAATIAAEAHRLCAHGVPDVGALARSYCLAALKESMRVHPPAPILYREVEQAFELDGFWFARDVAVWVSPQLLHHDPRYFPEPQRYLPERFVKGEPAAAFGSVYLPFGAGRRVCIGNHQSFLQMTLVTLLAICVGKWRGAL
jgi:enediyne biosynthesis protein E7